MLMLVLSNFIRNLILIATNKIVLIPMIRVIAEHLRILRNFAYIPVSCLY